MTIDMKESERLSDYDDMHWRCLSDYGDEHQQCRTMMMCTSGAVR
jgi:hypothetical protein